MEEVHTVVKEVYNRTVNEWEVVGVNSYTDHSRAQSVATDLNIDTDYEPLHFVISSVMAD